MKAYEYEANKRTLSLLKDIEEYILSGEVEEAIHLMAKTRKQIFQRLNYERIV